MDIGADVDGICFGGELDDGRSLPIVAPITIFPICFVKAAAPAAARTPVEDARCITAGRLLAGASSRSVGSDEYQHEEDITVMITYHWPSDLVRRHECLPRGRTPSLV